MLFFHASSIVLNIKELCRNCERSKVAVRRPRRRTFLYLAKTRRVFAGTPCSADKEKSVYKKARTKGAFIRSDQGISR